MSNFKNWLSANGKSIDMTGDAWQVHEIVDAYAGGLQQRIAEIESALAESHRQRYTEDPRYLPETHPVLNTME